MLSKFPPFRIDYFKLLILNFTLFSLLSAGAQDTVPPVINLNGPNPYYLYVGNYYYEYGATAYDNLDGDITHKLDTIGHVNVNQNDSVNTSVAGLYRVHYLVSDNIGNKTDTIRVVLVFDDPDTIPPIITLLGDNPMRLYIGDPYVEPGATAIDNKDGDITDSIKINSDSVNTSVVDTYRVHYTVSDSENNTTNEIRIVIVGSTGIQQEIPSNYIKQNNFSVIYNNGKISIRYTIPYSTSVKLEAYDIKGKLVKVITDKFMQKGSYKVNWDSKRLGAGVYFIKLSASSFVSHSGTSADKNSSEVSRKVTVIRWDF